VQFCAFTEPQQGADYETQLAHAQRAEKLGFDGWFRSDHFLAMGDDDGLPGPTDAWTTLAGLARETNRLRLGTLVSSATFRVPSILAIQVAQVDRMSGGRIELGLGTGWFAKEHEAYGIHFPEKRFGMLEEQLAIITGLWATPESATFSFDGDHYQLVDAPALPKPAQSTIPVIVGGGGPRRTPQIAARYATEFNIGFVDEETVAAKFDNVRVICVEEERDIDTLRLSVALPTVVAEDDAELRRRCTAAGIDPDSSHDERLVGRPAEVAAKIERLRELGASRIYLQTVDMTDLDHLDLIARDVIARVR
jgi:F420-dependent oxidoreductase-like protein